MLEAVDELVGLVKKEKKKRADWNIISFGKCYTLSIACITKLHSGIILKKLADSGYFQSLSSFTDSLHDTYDNSSKRPLNKRKKIPFKRYNGWKVTCAEKLFFAIK